jgi:hypothetical protein
MIDDILGWVGSKVAFVNLASSLHFLGSVFQELYRWLEHSKLAGLFVNDQEHQRLTE